MLSNPNPYDIYLTKHRETCWEITNRYDCPKCEFKTMIQYELFNHTMNLHDIENDNTTHEDLASLGGYQPKYKIHTGSNTNTIMSDNTIVKEKTYMSNM